MNHDRTDIKIQFLTFFEEKGSRGYPVGLLFLSAYLKKMGFTTIRYCELTLSLTQYNELQKINSCNNLPEFAEINQFSPDIIFLGPVFSYCLSYLPLLCQKIKIFFPNVLLFAGGYHFGADLNSDRRFLTKNCPELNGLLIGKAEETIHELMELNFSLKNSDIFPSISFLSDNFHRQIGQIAGILTSQNQFLPRISHMQLDQMPLPDYTILFTHPFRKSYTLADRKNPHIKGNGTFFAPYLGKELEYGIIVGSRGCPYDCAFCSGARPIHSEPGILLRETRSAENIFAELMIIYQKFGTRLFLFSDPLFMAATPREVSRILALCEKIMQSGIQFRFIIEIRVDVLNKLDSEVLTKLMQSGFVEFNLGLEKGTDASLANFSKHITIADQMHAITKLRTLSRQLKIPILINGTFILGGPDELLWNNLQTIRYATRLPLDQWKFFILELYPNTRLYQTAIQHGILKKGLSPYLVPGQIPLYFRSSWELRILRVLLRFTTWMDKFKTWLHPLYF